MSGAAFKGTLLVSLILALIAIWVRNLYLLMPEDRAAEQTHEAANSGGRLSASDASTRGSEFAIDRELRSPFATPQPPEPKSAVKTVSTKSAKLTESIRSSLIGCVYSTRQSHIVVVDSVSGNTGVLRTGDTLNGFVLMKIRPNEILWKSLKGRRVVWHPTK
jgi:hypothetical protein